MYVDDADWKDVVNELAAKAQLVVLRPGITKALLWEAETVAQVAGGDKVAFYVPGLPAGVWAQFVKELGTALGIPLPSRLDSEVIVLCLRDRVVRDLRWKESPAVAVPGLAPRQYVPTRSFVKPLFRFSVGGSPHPTLIGCGLPVCLARASGMIKSLAS